MRTIIGLALMKYIVQGTFGELPFSIILLVMCAFLFCIAQDVKEIIS